MAKTRDFRPTTPASFRNSDNDVIEVDSDNPLPVSATVVVGTSGIATSAKQDALDGHVTAMSAKLPAALGQTTGAASMSVVPASDAGLATATNQSTEIAAVTGLARTAVADASAVTRPANTDAYAANDAVSNSATAGSVTPIVWTVSDTNDAPVVVRRIRIASTDTGPGTASATFRIWLYRSDPTASSGVVGGDNAAFSTKQGSFVGSLTGSFRLFSDGSVATCVPEDGADLMVRPTSGAKTLYGLLQTLTAFTPSANSTTFTCTIEAFQGRA